MADDKKGSLADQLKKVKPTGPSTQDESGGGGTGNPPSPPPPPPKKPPELP